MADIQFQEEDEVEKADTLDPYPVLQACCKDHWDQIADNGLIALMRLGSKKLAGVRLAEVCGGSKLKLEIKSPAAPEPTTKVSEKQEMGDASTAPHPPDVNSQPSSIKKKGTLLYGVVLVYLTTCNPLLIGEIDAMRHARFML
jgi:hypothetical protein